MDDTSTTPLSVLDLATVGVGQTSAEALHATTALARRAEALGYRRFWVAEHHGMPAVASTSPPVLMAHLAASTDRIRIGSGGVMLPNHPPLVVAEQMAMLEALHPGRIDVGLGRAPGTDPHTAAALRRAAGDLGVESFPDDVVDLLALLEGRHPHLLATPSSTSAPPVVLLGSSGYSAQLAGMLGLPFAFAHHFSGGGTSAALAAYRAHFRPSAALERPHVIVTAGVLLADTEEEARRQAAPSQLLLLALRTGRLGPLAEPDEAVRHPSLEMARQLPSTAVIGTPASGVAALRRLVDETAADELMVTTTAHGLAARERTLELLADAWQLRRGAARPPRATPVGAAGAASAGRPVAQRQRILRSAFGMMSHRTM